MTWEHEYIIIILPAARSASSSSYEKSRAAALMQQQRRRRGVVGAEWDLSRSPFLEPDMHRSGQLCRGEERAEARVC